MSEVQATPKCSYAALKALPREERDAVLVRIAGDKSLRRNLLDLAIVAGRRSEPSRAFRRYSRQRRRRE